MMFLPLLPCQVHLDLSTLPHIEVLADCIAEVEEGEAVFSVGATMEPRSVQLMSGGVHLLPFKLDQGGNLSSWMLPALSDGTYRLRIRYGGEVGFWGDGEWQTSLREGLFPLGGAPEHCALLAPSAVGMGAPPMGGDVQKGVEGRLFCSTSSNLLFAPWKPFARREHPDLAIFTLGDELHPDWFSFLDGQLKKGESVVGPRPRKGLLVAEGPRPHSERGLIILPKGGLGNAPNERGLAESLAAQWSETSSSPLSTPIGRVLLPTLGWGTTDLSMRLSERARLSRTQTMNLPPYPLLRETLALASGKTLCDEGLSWPGLSLVRTEIPFLRNGGYELVMVFDWKGRCDVDLTIDLSDNNHTDRISLNLPPGRTTISRPLDWAPRQIVLDPLGLFLGSLDQDRSLPLLADLWPEDFQLWTQPLGFAATIGPGGSSWPQPGEIRLPDGSRHPWTEESLFLVAGQDEGWVATAHERADPLIVPNSLWGRWGWVLMEEEQPIRWGIQAMTPPLILPPPNRFPWGNN
ncbi:hypothetical protein H8D30_05925 [bacterium]|nr:hypothetical protein [bacterium]